MRLFPVSGVSGVVLLTAVATACGSTSNDNNGSGSGTQTPTNTVTSTGTSTSTSTSGTSGAAGASGSTAGTSGGSGSLSGASGGSGSASTATTTSTSTGTATTDGGTGPSGAPNALHVMGNRILDGNGNTVVLRGVAVPDVGLLYSQNSNNISGVTGRIDEILGPAGLAVKAVRLPVYPRTVVNSGSPTYSPVPYPVGMVAPNDAGGGEMSAPDYIANILKPAVDYVTSKNLYAIVDFHQIDNVTTGTSSADAVTFWTTVAPVFAGYPNVIYEAFNEPIDNKANAGVTTAGAWTAAFTMAAQSWVTAIRTGAPNNVIIVGSPQWSQYPDGAMAANLTGGNLVYTAHIYPGNWPTTNNTFLTRVTNAAMNVPVAVTEWGYEIGTASTFNNLATPDDTWAQALQTLLNTGGESWTAWVADPYWGPAMFNRPTGTGGVNGFSSLTDFGTFVQKWLAAGGSTGTSTGSGDGGTEQ
jgi:endoglucanase